MLEAAASLKKNIFLRLAAHRKDFQFIKRRQSQNEPHKDWIY